MLGQKFKRRIWKIPINSHKHIVYNLSSDCKNFIEKRILKFIHNGLNSKSECANLLQVKLTCTSNVCIHYYDDSNVSSVADDVVNIS